MMIRLSEYASLQGIKYQAAWLRYKAGKIEGAVVGPTGRILVPHPFEQASTDKRLKAVLYARVSSTKQKDDLERQVSRLEAFAASRGLEIVHIVQEVASGVNDERPKLTKLLQRDDWGTLVVEHRDRLTRVGYNWFDLFLQREGRQLLVMNQAAEQRDGLIEDLVSIIYSFSAQLHGKRGSKQKADRAIKELGIS